MATINTDCHITLSHNDINSSNPYGFLLQRADDENDPAVIIQRTITSDGEVEVKVFFNVLLADDLIEPDGGPHTPTRSTDYDMLMDYLAELEGVTLQCAIGAVANVGASGHSATETHYPGYSVVACALTNAGLYYGPVDLTDFDNSEWDGPLTWATSYWR